MKRQSPPQAPIITLLTDFGLQDEYVAVMKGVILCHCPSARIIDLSHMVPPQAIPTAMFLLNRSFRHFPEQTIHLAVVDPEVGTDRAILAIAAHGQFFIGPDNGIFTPLLTQESSIHVYCLDLNSPFSSRLSATFHGRDIMAPMAGKIANGVPLAKLGTKIDPGQCRRLSSAFPRRIAQTLEGEIIHIDRFGNLCSNLHRQDLLSLAPLDRLHVTISGWTLPLITTYAEVPLASMAALFDSNDYLEIACNRGDASKQLALGLGAPISVHETAAASTGQPIDQQRII